MTDAWKQKQSILLSFWPHSIWISSVFTRDPYRITRFEREAKLLASMNHPNIAAIYGLEQADGDLYEIIIQ
jgi:serine/threonine protein kinase